MGLFIESYLYDSFMTSRKDVFLISLLISFHLISLIELQDYAFLAFPLPLYSLSKVSPKALHSLLSFFYFITLISLMSATPLISLLLVLVLLTMQMFWPLARALRRLVPL